MLKCEQQRNLLQLKLKSELKKLETACGKDTPNIRLVGNLLTNSRNFHEYWSEGHVKYVGKTDADSNPVESSEYTEKLKEEYDLALLRVNTS